MNNKIPEYEIKYSKIKNIYIQIKNGKITVIKRINQHL